MRVGKWFPDDLEFDATLLARLYPKLNPFTMPGIYAHDLHTDAGDGAAWANQTNVPSTSNERAELAWVLIQAQTWQAEQNRSRKGPSDA